MALRIWVASEALMVSREASMKGSSVKKKNKTRAMLFENYLKTRRSEKDSTLGWPRSENALRNKLSMAISYSDPLHGKLHHATKFQAVMWFPQFHLPGLSLSWKISMFRGTPKDWPSMPILSSDLLHGTVHHFTKFHAGSWNPLRFRAVKSSLGPVPSLFWKFKVPCNAQKLLKHGHFI